MLGLVAILINQGVGHGHIRLLLRSRNRSSRITRDLAILELQAVRKTLNLEGAFLNLEALRQRTKTLWLYFLLVILANNTVLQRRIRHHNLRDDLFQLLLCNPRLLGLLDTLRGVFLIRVLPNRVTVFIGDANVLLYHDLNLTGYGHFSSARLGWNTSDLAGLRVDLKAIWQLVGGVLRLRILSEVIRQVAKQVRNIVVRVFFPCGAKWQLLWNDSGKRVRNLPAVRHLLRNRINADNRRCVDGGFLQVFGRLEITGRQHTLLVTLDDALLTFELGLITSRIGCVPTNRVIRIRHQTRSLRGHLRPSTTLIVIRVVLRDIKDRLCRHQRELQAVHVRTRDNSAGISVVLEHVHRERRILHITTLDTWVDVHVIRIDVTTLPNSETSEGAVTAASVHFVLRRYLAELVF